MSSSKFSFNVSLTSAYINYNITYSVIVYLSSKYTYLYTNHIMLEWEDWYGMWEETCHVYGHLECAMNSVLLVIVRF